MIDLKQAVRQFVLSVFLVSIAVPVPGQVIRLPGGITIGGPQQGNRPTAPRGRVERPDPASVCPKTVEWVGILQKEYPNVDLLHTMSNKVQQMGVPLFADDAFQKTFGVSYSTLSDTDRQQFFRTHLIPCNSRQFGQQMILLDAFHTAFMPGTGGMGPLSPGQLIPALTRLAAARTELRSDEQALNGIAPSAEIYDRAMALSGQRQADLVLVWPSEKAQFNDAVKSAVSRSAGVAVEAKIQPLLTAPPTLESAQALQRAPQTFHVLFAAMPADQSTQLQAKLSDRRNAVLKQLLPAQQAKASSFPATRQGLDDGAAWFNDFSGSFLQSPAPQEAEDLAKSYLARREATLTRMAPQFRQKIEETQDLNALASLYDDVFKLPADRDSPTWQQVSSLRTTRLQLLTERAEQAHRAEQEREERAAIARGEVVLSSLKVAGLQNATVFKALYAGEGAPAGLSRSNFLFTNLFQTYLIRYGQMCRESLPQDRVEMTYQRCTGETRYGYYQGWAFVQTGSECSRWETTSYKPAAYADPRVYRAEEGAEKFAELAMLQNTLRNVFKDPFSPFTAAGTMLMTKETVEQDVPALIQQNGCNSKALARLQENMTRLATDQDPLHLPGHAPDRTHMTLARDLNSRSLADDLIRADSADWILNKYRGLNGADVGASDSEGRPRRVHATYSQGGLGRDGSVDIAFTDGVPTCLYFSDAPTNCKTPDPAVVQRYQSGGYRH